MLKQRDPQKLGKCQGAKVAAMPAVMSSAVGYGNLGCCD